MPTERQKLYLYVDETGQETRKAFFLVTVTAIGGEQRDAIDTRLLQLEEKTQKGLKKWTRTSPSRQAAYLEGLVPVLSQIAPLYWRQCAWQKESYLHITAEAIVAAVQHRDAEQSADLTIVIDGLKRGEREFVTRIFRSHRLSWKKVVGGRDESTPFLRLADAMAGFLRDVTEQKPHAQAVWQRLKPYFHEL